MSSNEIEQLYGNGNASPANRNDVAYDEKGLAVGYPLTEPRNVQSVIRTWNPEIPLEVGRAESKAYIPTDAQYLQTRIVRGYTVDLYHSPWLATRFPNGPWGTAEPGIFTILCRITANRSGANRGTECTMKIGNEP